METFVGVARLCDNKFFYFGDLVGITVKGNKELELNRIAAFLEDMIYISIYDGYSYRHIQIDEIIIQAQGIRNNK